MSVRTLFGCTLSFYTVCCPHYDFYPSSVGCNCVSALKCFAGSKFMHKFSQSPLYVLPLVIKVPLKSLTNDVYATAFAYVKFVCTSVVLRLAQARSSLRSKASSFNWGI